VEETSPQASFRPTADFVHEAGGPPALALVTLQLLSQRVVGCILSLSLCVCVIECVIDCALVRLQEAFQVGGANPGFQDSTMQSLAMIIVTELGDKTFCIAAVMAMTFGRWQVFSGAAGALLVMTVLSVAIGFALPNLMPRVYTHYAAAILVSKAALHSCYLSLALLSFPVAISPLVYSPK
jgi:hypothetical protein